MLRGQRVYEANMYGVKSWGFTEPNKVLLYNCLQLFHLFSIITLSKNLKWYNTINIWKPAILSHILRLFSQPVFSIASVCCSIAPLLYSLNVNQLFMVVQHCHLSDNAGHYKYWSGSTSFQASSAGSSGFWSWCKRVIWLLRSFRVYLALYSFSFLVLICRYVGPGFLHHFLQLLQQLTGVYNLVSQQSLLWIQYFSVFFQYCD